MRLTGNTLSENIRTETSELLNRHVAAAIDLSRGVDHQLWLVESHAAPI